MRTVTRHRGLWLRFMYETIQRAESKGQLSALMDDLYRMRDNIKRRSKWRILPFVNYLVRNAEEWAEGWRKEQSVLDS